MNQKAKPEAVPARLVGAEEMRANMREHCAELTRLKAESYETARQGAECLRLYGGLPERVDLARVSR